MSRAQRVLVLRRFLMQFNKEADSHWYRNAVTKSHPLVVDETDSDRGSEESRRHRDIIDNPVLVKMLPCLARTPCYLIATSNHPTGSGWVQTCDFSSSWSRSKANNGQTSGCTPLKICPLCQRRPLIPKLEDLVDSDSDGSDLGAQVTRPLMRLQVQVMQSLQTACFS
jgi:hypothetical protein